MPFVVESYFIQNRQRKIPDRGCAIVFLKTGALLFSGVLLRVSTGFTWYHSAKHGLCATQKKTVSVIITDKGTNPNKDYEVGIIVIKSQNVILWCSTLYLFLVAHI